MDSGMEDLIWDQLESPYPSFSENMVIWKYLIYEWEYSAQESKRAEDLDGMDYFEHRLTSFLLILASEGKQIHWD